MNRSLKISPSSTCQISVESECWNWNQRFMRCLGSTPTRGNILLLDFFSRSKTSDANIVIIANNNNNNNKRIYSFENIQVELCYFIYYFKYDERIGHEHRSLGLRSPWGLLMPH